MNAPDASARSVPTTEHALQFVAAGEIVHNRAKPVPALGAHQMLVRMEACGICFSDTKLLHAFSAHPRKSEVRGGLAQAALAEIPSYVPGELPTVPGHEAVCRIVAVGPEVRHHRVGERCLVQTDYRHLPTVLANAAFGYNFEGGLQEYVVLDERVVMEPETGERFMIPVGEEPSASAIALVEPWACVEASYVYRERSGLRAGGRLLVVADRGHRVDGVSSLLENARPAEITALIEDDADRVSVESLGMPVRFVGGIDALPAESFDDVVYFGADPARIESLQDTMAPRSLMNVVTGGQRIGRPVALDVGRIHYDLTRWIGSHTGSAADAYATVPADGELRPEDRVAVIGAAGPMGLMHVVRAATAGIRGLSIAAIDIDDARLEHLEQTVAPIARTRHVALSVVNSRSREVPPGFDYVALMVPAPPLVGQAVELAGNGCRINIFAGFANRTRVPVDLDRYIDRRCYFLGTSGSLISDMKAVLAKLERGDLDTNISLDAVTGFEGVAEALAAVEGRTSSGKIMVYPSLPDLGLVRLTELADRFPSTASKLVDGRWTRAAEDELLREAAPEAAPWSGADSGTADHPRAAEGPPVG